jgi:hypothetical protein
MSSIYFDGNTYTFGATISANIGTGTTSYVFGGLTSGFSFGFIIRAFNGFGFSNLIGPIIRATPLEIGTFDVNQFGEEGFVLNWGITQDPEGFQLFRGNSPLTGLTVLPGDVRGYIDTGLTKGITYTYEVVAYRSTTTSPPKGGSKVIPTLGIIDILPGVPVGLTAIGGLKNKIDLSWNIGSGGLVDGYIIYRSKNGTKYSFYDANLGETAYADRNVIFGTTYYYKVISYNNGGSSGEAGPVFARALGFPPTTPTGLTAGNIDENSVNLTWNDNSINENLFKIYYRFE